ncbi:MAG TPA: peptidylprolyl isomerase [Vicinamibacterales bacterium]|nr:peptidylprolyl isomerase [Vicinamibacterales bacterium]
MKFLSALSLLLIVTAVSGCGTDNASLTKDPAVPTADAGPDVAPLAGEADVPKGESYYALFRTSEGDFILAVHPGWAPLGAERFRELLETKYYDNCRFFRVLDGFMAQVGVNGDPAVSAQWRDRAIQDEPAKVSNQRGRVTYAKGGPNSRTTQIFFNYGDNRQLDADAFAPFAEVVKGMDVLGKLYSAYGEGAPHGAGPDQGRLNMQGNEYLQAEFPELDYIKSARIYDTLEAAEVAMSGDDADSTEASTDAPSSKPPATSPPAGTQKVDSPATETPAEQPAATEPVPASETPAAEPAPATDAPAAEEKSGN